MKNFRLAAVLCTAIIAASAFSGCSDSNANVTETTTEASVSSAENETSVTQISDDITAMSEKIKAAIAHAEAVDSSGTGMVLNSA